MEYFIQELIIVAPYDQWSVSREFANFVQCEYFSYFISKLSYSPILIPLLVLRAFNEEKMYFYFNDLKQFKNKRHVEYYIRVFDFLYIP